MPDIDPSAPAEPNLAAAIRLHAARRPNATALVECGTPGRRQCTWAEFDRGVEASASAFAELGAVAGQRVLIETPNTLEAVFAWFGALRAGVIAVPLNPELTTAELARVAEHSGAVLLVARADAHHPDLPGVRRVGLGELADHAGAAPVVSPADPEAIAAVLYTAGTSAEPRGAMLSHRALIAHCVASQERGLARSGSRVLCLLPLFHVFGLNAVLGAAVFTGATVILVDGVADDLARVLTDEHVTHLPLTPSVLYRLAQDAEVVEASRSLELITSGAAPLPAALAELWQRLTGVAVQQGYGLTEASPGVATTVGAPKWLGSNHVGRALPGVEIRIGDGRTPTEPAEVFIRGRTMFSGYWPDGAEGVDADGWFGTGDVGYLRGADLFLVDRLREMVIVSGFNVYPHEVEAVLEDHQSVTAAAVVGRPDEGAGERVIAFVTPEAVDVPALSAYAASRLARYKLPAEILVLPTLPRSATGKVRKALLREWLDQAEEDDG